MAVNSRSRLSFERGRAAERMAADIYRERGASVLRTNYRVRGGEIDFIALDGDTVAFVEVKMRASTKSGLPEEAVTLTKRRRICRAALQFAQENGLMDAPLRFDVCAISGGEARIYENAFDYVE